MSDRPPSELSRGDLASQYLDQLPYPPYPFQEEALLTWFTSEQGILVTAPTGMGKTLIAEAAAYEALHTRQVIYYTTPLIALSEQKFRDLQAAAVKWGFPPEDVGLVTGNRRVNPEARVLVVVAEILLNRLLQQDQFGFEQVNAVVMDEFHSFSDLERGIVWEFSLSLLPKHVRLLLLSATVGNAVDFTLWLRRCHGRDLELVRTDERRVPLKFQWVPDKLLNEHLEEMAGGEDEGRRTPALVFCFNRDECWSVADELKGRAMLADGQQKKLNEQLLQYDLTKGAGPKLKQILVRGVGVHHAGLLPRYKRVVEDLFNKKLLSMCICTETLAAGINLPARSVVLPSLMKGRSRHQKLIEPSSAQQIFGRAGRPQFDKIGFVYALPHEDDVKILRWKEKYDQIPEDTKDPNLIRAKKALKKKQPTRNPEKQYWNEQQFDRIRQSPPGDLVSRGPLPWRLLAYLLRVSADVTLLHSLVQKRLMEPKQIEIGERHLDRMLITLHEAGCVRLEPEPPPKVESNKVVVSVAEPAPQTSWLSRELQKALDTQYAASKGVPVSEVEKKPPAPVYRPKTAHPTEKLDKFFVLRSVNPLFGMYLVELMGVADEAERLQLIESVLEVPGSMMRSVRVPPPHKMPPGPLAKTVIDNEIIQRGILPAGDIYPEFDPKLPPEERKYAPALAEKVKLVFEHKYPDVHDVSVQPVWIAADVLLFGGDFHNYISGRELAKQEGLIFRHLLRLILVLGEFSQLSPPDYDPEQWRSELRDLAERLTACCRGVDPDSTEYMLSHAGENDVVPHEPPAVTEAPPDTASAPGTLPEAEIDFGGGLDVD